MQSEGIYDHKKPITYKKVFMAGPYMVIDRMESLI